MSEIEDRSTIYRIVHVDSGRCYIGHTSAALRFRLSQHRATLRKGSHHSPFLQNAWTKHGEDAFVFETIEICPESDKLIREQHFIDTEQSDFNHCKVAGSRKGCPQPAHEVERIRQMMKGNQYTKGRVQPEDERQRRSATMKGREQTPEHRAAAKAAMKGVPHPNAVGHVVSAETRAKIKAATDATRPTMTGRHHSEASKAKASASMKAVIAARGHWNTGKKYRRSSAELSQWQP